MYKCTHCLKVSYDQNVMDQHIYDHERGDRNAHYPQDSPMAGPHYSYRKV